MGDTPLLACFDLGENRTHIEVARALLAYGADTSVRNNCGDTVLLYIRYCGGQELIPLLQPGSGSPEVPDSGQ